MKRNSKRKCVAGVSCGGACINRGKKCRIALSREVSGMLSRLKGRMEEKADYSSWNPLAEGYQGEIRVNPEETRVVKLWKDKDSEFSQEEIRIATRMGELGHSPKIYSSSPKHLEMDLVKGAPLWKNYQKSEGDPVMNTEQARKAGYAFKDLHKLGYAHGDAHSQQFIVGGNNVRLVDFGLIVSTKVQPSRVMQDLSKIASLVRWDNPELSSDPYFQLVNKYLDQYRALGRSTSKAAKAKRIKLGEGYLKELENLK